jgi:hypothetical protein
MKQLVVEAGRWVLRCAFCLGLVMSADPEVPTRLTIDSSLAQVNNIEMAVPSGGSIVITPGTARLTLTTHLPTVTVAPARSRGAS